MRDQLLDFVENPWGNLTIGNYSEGFHIGNKESSVFIHKSEAKWLIKKLTDALNGDWISE